MPKNNGLLRKVSAKMHPTAQTSTALVYLFWPNKISGALYQRVSTSWVRVLSGIMRSRARPKSAILTFPANDKKGTFEIDENVLGFEVSVENFFLMAEVDAGEYFFDDGFGLFFVDGVVFGVDEFFKIVLIEIKDDFEVLLDGFVDDIAEGDDVGVFFEVFEGGDFAEGGGGNALVLVFELDVFDGD